MNFTLLSIFKACLRVVDVTIVIKSTILKETEVSKELSLVILSQNTFGLPIIGPTFQSEKWIDSLIYVFQEVASEVLLTIGHSPVLEISI